MPNVEINLSALTVMDTDDISCPFNCHMFNPSLKLIIRRTDNSVAKKKGQRTIYITLHRKLKIE